MPGTIHVSVLELMGLPSPPQSSSMGVKVSMGKQAHEMQDKEETSFTLASLRDNLNVSIHDSEGNEIAHTDVETRSIVEKGTWDDLFPLQDGGHIRMRLHFILTEDELNRIRSMRESAARKKREDLLKRSHSSSDLAGASGGRPASSQDSLKSQERSVYSSDGQANKLSADSNVEVLNKAQPGQKKQPFSTSKSTGALDKLPAYQQLKERIQGQGAEQQSQLDKTPSNVRKMILALNSSPVKEEPLATNKTWTTQLSSSAAVDIPSKAPSIKKMVDVKTKSVLSKLETATEEVREERGNLLPATNKTKETDQLSSNTTVDTPSKVSILKKMVFFSTKPVLSNLDTMPACSTSEGIGKERGKLLPATIETKETAQLRSKKTVDNPSKVPILKKTVAVNTKTVLFDLETAPAPSTSGDIGKERGKLLHANNRTKETSQLSSIKRVDAPYKVPILKKIAAVNSKTVFSNPETAPAPSTSEGRGKDGDNGSSRENISDENKISKTQPTLDENKEGKNSLKKWHTSPVSERGIYSLKTLLEALPRKKQFSTDLFNKMYGYTTNDAFVEKKWRSKQWKTSRCREKSKVFEGNEHCSIDSFRGWIFLDEMIRSCVLSDDGPVVDELEGCLSNCSQDNDQEKLTDTGDSQRKSDKGSIGSKRLESNRRPNNMPFTGPGGQVMKIVIMAGFGLLVLLTRQRK